ncbi:hypothetical protein [Streptomyces capitiformicae]|uniref:Monooxygenase n=1 Tax=Streptomyces capitiformicae TaxID=2014920 RepID=A0A919DIQ9_9ACTN|nr:hypothetical protein [Streptomyces capitiformicae]GHE46551.1 hypothetical protein GCM10017771_67230 [Streptomyces capitiformicae]
MAKNADRFGHCRADELGRGQVCPPAGVGEYPPVTGHFPDGTTAQHDVLVGADGIDSLVRRTLWGPKQEHRLHIFGGFTFTDVPAPNRA